MEKKLSNFCIGHTFPYIQAMVGYKNPVIIDGVLPNPTNESDRAKALLEFGRLISAAKDQDVPINNETMCTFLLIQKELDPKFEFFKLLWPLFKIAKERTRVDVVAKMLNVTREEVVNYIEIL